MELTLQKELSAALKKAMADEHLWSRDAGRLLNLNPIYISMMLNSKVFSKASTFAWNRLEEWHKSGEQLSSFVFPAQEPVWKQSEKCGIPNVKKFPTIPEKTEKAEKKEKAESQDKRQQIKVSPAADSSVIIPTQKEILEKNGFSLLEELPINIGRLKVALDVEINLMVNGQRVKLG